MIRKHGHRTRQGSGQRNTTITPEMQAAQWKPGESGNAGGRPKKTPITDALRALIEEPYGGNQKRFKGLTNARVLAITMYEQAIAGDLGAAKEIADRVQGKVAIRQELSGPDGSAIPWTSYADRSANEQRILELELLAQTRSTGDYQ
jgi:hypothetical protein